jgi:beta-glucosidase
MKAGTDMSMADQVYIKQLPELVRSGKVSQQELDNAVRDILGAKYDLGLFKDPFVRIGRAADDPADVYADAACIARAREVAQQSMVLLENRNATLPLKKNARIALVGPLADSHIDMLGSWSAAGATSRPSPCARVCRPPWAGRASWSMHAAPTSPKTSTSSTTSTS